MPAIIENRGHDACLLCGGSNPWSLGLTFRPTPSGGVETDLRLHSLLQGYDGMIHGGVIAAVLDAAMTHSLFDVGVRAVTAELLVRYLKPLACDGTVFVRARVTSSMPPLHLTAAEIVRDGEVIARSEGKFIGHEVSPQ